MSWDQPEYEYTDCDSNLDAHEDSHADRDSNAHPHEDSHANFDAYQDSHTNEDTCEKQRSRHVGRVPSEQWIVVLEEQQYHRLCGCGHQLWIAWGLSCRWGLGWEWDRDDWHVSQWDVLSAQQ